MPCDRLAHREDDPLPVSGDLLREHGDFERAREWYERAEEGIPMLAEDARLPVRASLANP